MIAIRIASWIAGAVFVTALIILFLHLSANNMEFSRYNTGWNGTSAFFSDLDRHRTTEVFSPASLTGEPGNATLLIIAPERSPTAGEIDGYRAFLASGGTIFLADDFGTGSAILKGIGSRITINSVNISSIDRKFSDPYLLVAYKATAESAFGMPPEIVLNGAALLEGGTPLALTSVMSWSDTNGDRRLNRGEDMGTLAVMARDPIGSGQVIVLSDPSIFVNSMYTDPELEDNRAFIRSLTANGGPILVDQMNSRTADAKGLSGFLHVVRNTAIIEILIFCLLILVVAGAWWKKAI